ncbi:MAG: chorismate lyase [Ectothiorhodospiraceae bacterium]|nr:chorismate lyase [Ectothiorhodospiraceae bacterium]MCH8502854.1 chorismate lyase [Ectothiorhodospiraceae bacterium]
MRAQFPAWWTSPPGDKPLPASGPDSWLRRTNSLTARLRHRCGAAFAVRVLDEGWRRPSLDEARRLRLPYHRLAWVREVALTCDGRPLVFARSVIPSRSLVGPNRALRTLGSRPLGELLFAGAGTRRDPLEVVALQSHHWLFHRVGELVGSDPPTLWARRRVHWLNRRPLLVAEVFLPELFD